MYIYLLGKILGGETKHFKAFMHDQMKKQKIFVPHPFVTELPCSCAGVCVSGKCSLDKVSFILLL